MQFTKKTITIILLLILFTIVVATVMPTLFVWLKSAGILFLSALSPVVIGFIMALILNVPLNMFERRVFYKVKEKGKILTSRILSLICTLTVLLAVLTIIVYFLAPSIYESILDIIDKIPDYTNTIRAFLIKHNLPNNFIPEFIDGSIKELIEVILSFFENNESNLVGSIFNVASSVFGQTINFLLGFVFCLYILIQKERVIFYCANAVHALLPEKFYQKLKEVFKLCASTFANYISGQFIDAVLLGTLVLIAMLIFRIPYAPLIGTMISIFALIPMLGAWVSAGIAVVLLLMVNPWKALLFIIIYVLLQALDNYFIYPRIVGNAVGLPGILVLFAVLLGSKFAGIFGLIFGVPFIAVLYILFNEFIIWKLRIKLKNTSDDLVSNDLDPNQNIPLASDTNQHSDPSEF